MTLHILLRMYIHAILYPLHWNATSVINHVEIKCGSISELFIVSLMCFSLAVPHHTTLIIKVIECLDSWYLSPYLLSFFKVVLAIFSPLYFLIKFNTIWSISKTKFLKYFSYGFESIDQLGENDFLNYWGFQFMNLACIFIHSDFFLNFQ